ncbi:MAG TPA: MaoC family dehydratase [Trebonia sp.]|jgi:acyl dehydratase
MSESPGEIVRQRGLWFEELRTDVVYKHSPGRTIGEADNTLFSTLTMNPQSLHLDAAFSETTEFGERLVNSLLTMSVLVGLSVGHLTQGTIVANLGFGDSRFPAPVRHGDTLYAETVILDKRLSSSRPGQGIVKFEHTARNQHGEVVAVVTRTTLMRCRPADEGQPDNRGYPADEGRSADGDRPAGEGEDPWSQAVAE